MNKERRKAIGGLIGAVGLIVLLTGTMTDVYAATVGVLAALAIWIIGGAIARIVFAGGGE